MNSRLEEEVSDLCGPAGKEFTGKWTLKMPGDYYRSWDSSRERQCPGISSTYYVMPGGECDRNKRSGPEKLREWEPTGPDCVRERRKVKRSEVPRRGQSASWRGIRSSG